MSKSRNYKKPLLKLAVLLAALTLLAIASSPLREAKARALLRQAEAVRAVDPQKALGMAKVSTYIQGNPDNLITLAQWQQEAGDNDGAIKTLKRTYAKDSRYWIVRAKALLELNQIQTAESMLARAGETGKPILELIRKKPGTIGERVVLARELAEIKLYRSAARVLSSGELNTSGTILLAEIRLQFNEELDDVRGRLEEAVKNDPADIRLHELLKQVYEKLGNQNAASSEAAKVEALKAGRP